jgi:hypothetical protein
MKTNHRWILVKVVRGIPATIEFFKDEQKAILAESDWRSKMNADYDEARIFQACLKDVEEQELYQLESVN